MHTKKSRNLNEQRTHRSFLVNRKIIHVYNKKKGWLPLHVWERTWKIPVNEIWERTITDREQICAIGDLKG